MVAVLLALACAPSIEPEIAALPAVPADPAAPAPVTEGPAPAPPEIEVAPAVAAPGAFVPTPSQEAMMRAFSARDGSPSCADVEAGSPDPVGDLRVLVALVELPPSVPMRAAECLISAHADVAEGDFVAWMAGADTKGLAMLVSDRIDTLPQPVAARVVRAGIAGPHATLVRERVAKSSDASLRALVTP